MMANSGEIDAFVLCEPTAQKFKGSDLFYPGRDFLFEYLRTSRRCSLIGESMMESWTGWSFE
jgi:hypothetical protein